jgi:hypothetical protein
VAAVQAVDHGRGLARHLEEDLAAGVGMRLGHRHAALGQVLHQPQVKGQLLGPSGARTASARSMRWPSGVQSTK